MWIFFKIPWIDDYDNEFSDAWWDIVMPSEEMVWTLSRTFPGFIYKKVHRF
jgi:hypothetical protein